MATRAPRSTKASGQADRDRVVANFDILQLVVFGKFQELANSVMHPGGNEQPSVWQLFKGLEKV